MAIEEELLEPLKLYNYELKYKHQDNIDAYFNNLTQESGVDIAANKITCDEYYAYLAEIEKIKRKLGGKKGLRGFLIFMTVLGFAVGTVLILLAAFKQLPVPAAFIAGGVFLILVSIFCIIMNSTILSKKIAILEEKNKVLQEKANEKLKIANEQMACLNCLYDWGIPAKLMSQTTPIIKTDLNFSPERYIHMVENYNMKPSNGNNVSTIFVQSGTMLNNPFVYERDYVQEMIGKVYTGSIVITWVTYSRDSKGNSYPVTHTQTLTATITRPAAHYFLDTALIFASEAAPKLSFSRSKGEGNSLQEKDLMKFETKWDKKLKKMQESKVKTSFTPLSNSKFEGLFQAFDRDNEVEFRLLFTPLAQKNMISLLMSKKPYGDDFRFIKKKMINVIRSDHAQHLDFDGNPYHFRTFDYEKAKSNFTNYNMNYFQGIFYDFAPILSIPLYQQHKEYVFTPSGTYRAHTTAYEAEVLANFMDEQIFVPETCNTHIILKAEYVKSFGKADLYNMHSYGFRKEPRVEIVEKMGGDGHLHAVPVPWEEYIPVEDVHQTVIINVGGNRNDYIANKDRIIQLISDYALSSDIIYQRGLLSFPVKENIGSLNSEELIKMFSHKEA